MKLIQTTKTKEIYYDKVNNKFTYKYILCLSELPSEIEEFIGKIITKYNFQKNILNITIIPPTIEYKSDFIITNLEYLHGDNGIVSFRLQNEASLKDILDSEWVLVDYTEHNKFKVNRFDDKVQDFNTRNNHFCKQSGLNKNKCNFLQKNGKRCECWETNTIHNNYIVEYVNKIKRQPYPNSMKEYGLRLPRPVFCNKHNKQYKRESTDEYLNRMFENYANVFGYTNKHGYYIKMK